MLALRERAVSRPKPHPETLPICEKCGQEHRFRTGIAGCTSHKHHLREDGTTVLVPCGKAPTPGATICKSHGSAAPHVAAAAARRVEEQKAQAKAARQLARFGQPIDVNPAEALLDLVRWTAGEVAYWRARVVTLEETNPKALTWGVTSEAEKQATEFPGTDTTREAAPAVEYRMLIDASNRYAAYATAAIRAGIDERRVRLAESQGQIVSTALRAILDGLLTALLGAGMPPTLRPVWVDAVATIVPRELRALDAVADHREARA